MNNDTAKLDNLLAVFKNWPTTKGWYIYHSGERLVDLCFRIIDTNSASIDAPSEYHCYLTFDIESQSFNGKFGYWTPGDELPTLESKGEFADLIVLYKLESVASFPKEVLEQFKASIISFAANILIDRANIGQLEFDKALKASEYKDWYVWQWNGEYIDIENEFTTKEADGESDRHSINIHVTISPFEERSYIMLGTNEGDGFNDIKELEGDFDRTIKKIEHNETEDLFKKHREDCQSLIDEAEKIVKRYPWVLFAM